MVDSIGDFLANGIDAGGVQVKSQRRRHTMFGWLGEVAFIKRNEGDYMGTETIGIVNQGRGPQLSNKRITVQDLLPYYQEGASNEEICRWIPSLTHEEIAVLKDYIRDHMEEVIQVEKEIKAYHDRLRALQPAWTRANDHLSIADRKALLREKMTQRKASRNGAGDSGG
jgi:uncharacterized protein (DUF433 family)